MSSLPPITKGILSDGMVVYSFWADQSWEGFDSLAKYFCKFWDAELINSEDLIYNRTAEFSISDVHFILKYDSQDGIMFHSKIGMEENEILEKIYKDLCDRLLP